MTKTTPTPPILYIWLPLKEHSRDLVLHCLTHNRQFKRKDLNLSAFIGQDATWPLTSQNFRCVMLVVAKIWEMRNPLSSNSTFPDLFKFLNSPKQHWHLLKTFFRLQTAPPAATTSLYTTVGICAILAPDSTIQLLSTDHCTMHSQIWNSSWKQYSNKHTRRLM